MRKILLILFFSISACKKQDINAKNGLGLPVKLQVYALDKNNLVQIYTFKYNSKGLKIETKGFDKNMKMVSLEINTYSSNGSIVSQSTSYIQQDGTFKVVVIRMYNYNNQGLFVKEEKFTDGELTNWINYVYDNQKLISEIFYVRYPQFNDTSISGKNEYEYDALGKKTILRKFYGTNSVPSYTHQFFYSNNLLIREDITTYLYPETTNYVYNSRQQLIEKKHFEGTLLLDSETNTYNETGLLLEKVFYNIATSSNINTYINVYEY